MAPMSLTSWYSHLIDSLVKNRIPYSRSKEVSVLRLGYERWWLPSWVSSHFVLDPLLWGSQLQWSSPAERPVRGSLEASPWHLPPTTRGLGILLQLSFELTSAVAGTAAASWKTLSQSYLARLPLITDLQKRWEYMCLLFSVGKFWRNVLSAVGI